MSDLATLMRNPFQPGKIESVKASVRILPRLKQTALVSATMDKDVYRPGETVNLTVYLQPYHGAREKRELSLKLPGNLRDGDYELFIGDSDARYDYERSRAPGLFTPRDYDQLVDAIRLHYVGDQLYLALSERDMGLTVHGQEMPSLPPSVLSTLSASSERAFIRPTSGRLLAEKTFQEPTEFVGSMQMSVRVDRKGQR